jgi:hypothetical protein
MSAASTFWDGVTGVLKQAFLVDFWDPAGLWQNATQGTLTEGQKNEIQTQVNAEIDVAASGSEALADRAKAQVAKELTAVFEQADAEAAAANLWNPLNSTGLTRWMLIGGAVLIGWIILNTMVLRWVGPR